MYQNRHIFAGKRRNCYFSKFADESISSIFDLMKDKQMSPPCPIADDVFDNYRIRLTQYSEVLVGLIFFFFCCVVFHVNTHYMESCAFVMNLGWESRLSYYWSVLTYEGYENKCTSYASVTESTRCLRYLVL